MRAKRDDIVPPSRWPLYIEGSRSPLTVNNCRFRIVTSGTRDSGFRARLFAARRTIQRRCAHFHWCHRGARDRRKFLKDNARFEEYGQRSRKNIRFRARRGMCCILRKSIHTYVAVWVERRASLRNFQALLWVKLFIYLFIFEIVVKYNTNYNIRKYYVS